MSNNDGFIYDTKIVTGMNSGTIHLCPGSILLTAKHNKQQQERFSSVVAGKPMLLYRVIGNILRYQGAKK